MKILLVNPPRFQGMPVCRITRCENIIQESVFTPFDLLILASILRAQGHLIFFEDANAEGVSYPELKARMVKANPDITIFHVSQECFEHDLETGRLAKQLGSKTVAINWTFKTMAKEVYHDIKEIIDCFVVNHNYLTSIPENIEALPRIMDEESPMNLRDLPFPDWSLITDFHRYYTRVRSISPYAVTTSSWGCPMGCLFCNYRRTGYSTRTPEQVAEEMELLSFIGVKYIHFYDATFNLSMDRVYAICDEIERRKVEVKWFINARADQWDLDLAKRCKAVGLDGISFGIESFSQSILDLIEKGVTVEQNVQAVQNTKKAGIKTNLSLMIGFPGECPSDYGIMINSLKTLSPNGFFISPYGMCALPGTYWFEQARQQGKDFGRWQDLHAWGKWRSFCDHSPEELQETRKRIYKAVLWSYPYLTSNLKWLLFHPSDLKIGVEFLCYSLFKYVKGWRYFR